MEWRRSEGGCKAINNGTGGCNAELFITQNISPTDCVILCCLFVSLLTVICPHLATRTKTVKELLQLNWPIIDHYYLHCYTRWSMAPVLMTTSLLQDITITKQIITDAKLPRSKQSTCILRKCESTARGGFRRGFRWRAGVLCVILAL